MNTIPTKPTVGSSTPFNGYGIMWKRMSHVFCTCSIAIVFFPSALVTPSWLTTVEASSHHEKVLEIPMATEGIPKTLKFPLYEQESMQYFSAGLGKEERSLTYPPFPLKLIFVQGERAFLAGVSVDLMNEDGTLQLKILGENIEGPWLFLNISTGTYVVSGTDSNGTTIKKTITIQNDTTTVVHFRFP
jgi:hypothetical protein